MMIFKIIITGSFNAGKTEFIRQISEIDPITTDKPVTEKELKEIKAFTTVAMDFGRLTIDSDLVIHLYATPGQERFDFIYPLLVKNALALIILGDITDKKSLKAVPHYYKKFITLKRIPTVVALTKNDLENKVPEEKIKQILSELPDDIPIIRINATDKEDVKKAVLFALEQLDSDEDIEEVV
ncbi:GTP-binding protein [Hippea maritima]|uniref:Small GTP-binding protein n=1 Tax=Hippea maritima (strain ATCC 700847 / DSM 10411 / MH2) TaxID=760142 RepID=F2LW67_HIPMA|nr:ATP/GTP-binding protein [Hippea maritima]AEA34001.1 small GTP-binding protein [Hippea maritima DSM 10411]